MTRVSTPELDFERWIIAAKPNPVEYLRRQAVEVLIIAIATTPILRSTLVLKGGTLVSLAHHSPRTTSDIDFSATGTINRDVDSALDQLVDALGRTSMRYGYPEFRWRIQRRRYDPSTTGSFRNLELTIGYVKRGSSQERKFEDGRSPTVLEVDISFNEPLTAIEDLQVRSAKASILAYSVTDLIAEKYRAILQQAKRNRARRQDVFDIAYILRSNKPDASGRRKILKSLLTKAQARQIHPSANSLDDQEIIDRARTEYASLALEIEGPVLDFERDYETIRTFYADLPWDVR